MKYWNKQKEVRRRCWHNVKIRSAHGTGFSSPREGRITLQQDPSPGKFYIEYNLHTSSVFDIVLWFERKEDATWFALKYS